MAGRILRALNFLFSGDPDGLLGELDEAEALAEEQYQQISQQEAAEHRKADNLTKALNRRKARTLGLPGNLDSSAFTALACCLESLLERPYRPSEEQKIFEWLRETDQLLANAAEAGHFNVNVFVSSFDPRLERYFQTFLGSEAVQFLRLEIFSVILWVELNRGHIQREEYLCAKLVEMLAFLDSLSTYTNAQKPLGNPGGKWDPSYNPQQAKLQNGVLPAADNSQQFYQPTSRKHSVAPHPVQQSQLSNPPPPPQMPASPIVYQVGGDTDMA